MRNLLLVMSPCTPVPKSQRPGLGLAPCITRVLSPSC